MQWFSKLAPRAIKYDSLPTIQAKTMLFIFKQRKVSVTVILPYVLFGTHVLCATKRLYT